MDIDLGKYQYVVIDSSLYQYTLEEGLCEALGKLPEKTLCAASTFPGEVRELSAYLRENTAFFKAEYDSYAAGNDAAYETMGKNLRCLEKYRVKPYIRYYNEYGIRDGNAHYDTRDLVYKLVEECRGSQDGKLLVLTANVMLIQEIVLAGLSDVVDIYPDCEEWLKDRESLEKLPDNPEINVTDITEQDNLTLYDSQGGSYSLSWNKEESRKEGSEAKMYNVSRINADGTVEAQNGLLAKIYQGNTMRKLLPDIIREMKQYYDKGMFPWAALPCELLYEKPLVGDARSHNERIVGYLMKRINTVKQFDEHGAFCGAADDNLDYRETLKLCRAVLRQIMYLSNYGIYILDYGRNNFVEHVGGSAEFREHPEMWGVHFLDICSVGCKSGHMNWRTSDIDTLFPKRGETITKRDVLIGHFSELTYLFALQMLTGLTAINIPNGMTLKQEQLNIMEADNPSRETYEELVPPNIRDLADGVYSKRGGGHFSIAVLLDEVSTAYDSFPEGLTYGDLRSPDGEAYAFFESRTMKDVLPCARQLLSKKIKIMPGVDSSANTENGEKEKETKEEPVKSQEWKISVVKPPVGRVDPQHCSGLVKSKKEKIRPKAGDRPIRLRVMLHPLLVLLILLAVVLGGDMLRFSAENLGFDLSAYAQLRWQMIADWFATAFGSIHGWVSGLLSAGSGR